MIKPIEQLKNDNFNFAKEDLANAGLAWCRLLFGRVKRPLLNDMFQKESYVRGEAVIVMKLPHPVGIIGSIANIKNNRLFTPSPENMDNVRKYMALDRQENVESTLLVALLKAGFDAFPYDQRLLDILSISPQSKFFRNLSWRREDCVPNDELFEEARASFVSANADNLKRWRVIQGKRTLREAV